jgi:hypothetical protein
MELTQDVETGLIERVAADPAFANAMLDEIGELLLAGEEAAARGMLRVVVAGTTGFDVLSRPLAMTGEALRRALLTDSLATGPSLSAIFSALKRELGVAAS